MQHKKLQQLLDELDDLLSAVHEPVPQSMLEDAPLDAQQEDELTQSLDSVIQLDRSCRVSLGPIGKITQNIELPHATYFTFCRIAEKILVLVEPHCIPTKASTTYTTIQSLIQSKEPFSLQEMFTLTSITITMAALCICDLPIEIQTSIVRLLDQLLNIKLQQLKLLNELVSPGNASGWVC